MEQWFLEGGKRRVGGRQDKVSFDQQLIGYSQEGLRNNKVNVVVIRNYMIFLFVLFLYIIFYLLNQYIFFDYNMWNIVMLKFNSMMCDGEL